MLITVIVLSPVPHNLNGEPLAAIPRLKGEFLWSQMIAAKPSGCKKTYVAIFDEVDEGTAIFKCTMTCPLVMVFSFFPTRECPANIIRKEWVMPANFCAAKFNRPKGCRTFPTLPVQAKTTSPTRWRKAKTSSLSPATWKISLTRVRFTYSLHLFASRNTKRFRRVTVFHLVPA